MHEKPNVTSDGYDEGVPPEYYVHLGIGHDYLLRCKDCRRLVGHESVTAFGGCPHCGCRKVTQISTLSTWEWFKIRVGIIRFKYRNLFLQEFKFRALWPFTKKPIFRR